MKEDAPSPVSLSCSMYFTTDCNVLLLRILTIVSVCEHNAQCHLEGVLAIKIDDSATSRHKLLGVLIEELHEVAPECGCDSTWGADIYLHLQHSPAIVTIDAE